MKDSPIHRRFTVVVRCSNVNEYESSLDNALNDRLKWLPLNNLAVNLDKTKFMQFHLLQSRLYCE